MSDESAGAAPAPSPAPESAPPSPAPVSAERAAAETGDFGAFDRAAVARKQGQALPDVAPPTSAAGAAEGTDPEGPDEPMPGRPLSRRQREIIHYKQQIAIQDQRIRDLERRSGRPSEADQEPPPTSNSNGQPAPAQPPPETAQSRAARYLALPDAPKVDDFDTYPEHTAAQHLFLEEQRDREKAAVAEQRQQQQAQHERLIARDQAFRERLTAARDGDPAFVAGLSAEARDLHGLDEAKRRGVNVGPAHIIGELLYDSPQLVPFLKYISADPQALAQLVALPDAIARLPAQARAANGQWYSPRVTAHIHHLTTEFRRLEGRLASEAERAAADTAPRDDDAPPSSVSSAPPPPPTLTKAGRSADPVRSALERGDFAAYDAAEMARKIRQRTGSRGGR